MEVFGKILELLSGAGTAFLCTVYSFYGYEGWRKANGYAEFTTKFNFWFVKVCAIIMTVFSLGFVYDAVHHWFGWP